MATLVLTAVGTLVGGPLGGAIGAIAGRTIDGAIIGGGSREGPRLKELSVTTSSYGTPIPRLHGRMRAAGTIIWATDLAEHRESSGGGKGKPSTTSYSYSTSFAVALASRPIQGVGRIWADGNLLRGAAGDLKTGGTLRIHTGHGDQARDPLMASAQANSPAYRHRAYAVFEDLSLADFGNRIPALTFEVIADDGSVTLSELVAPIPPVAGSGEALAGLAGYAYEGGALLDTLAAIDSVYPLACDAGGDMLTVRPEGAGAAQPLLLPEAATAWEESDFGQADGRNRRRDADPSRRPDALRYYDTGRDYQPGVQRTGGRAQSGRTRTIEFPGALSAGDARGLADAAARRAGWRRETLAWRVAELDPAIAPGTVVRAPGMPGLWRVAGWEWRERGVELDLERLPPAASAAALPGDPGLPGLPADSLPQATLLQAFELPWDGYGDGNTPMLFAAASAGAANWSGAALYANRGGELKPIGTTGRARSTMGSTIAVLPPSASLLIEERASFEVELAADDMVLAPATLAAIATGANRLLVGGEVLQFAQAEQTGARRWRLSGLLRGRGGTEPAAQIAHPAGTPAVLLDAGLIALDPAQVTGSGAETLAAIGFGDEAPVTAEIANRGAGARPPCPVHPRARAAAVGGLSLAWTRRARGAWDWPGEVETPLVEQSEAYRVGCGPVDSPNAAWTATQPALTIDTATLAALAADHPGAAIWVRQIGSLALSDPLLLTTV